MIDALYNSVIFEFKKDLKRERGDAMVELKKYFIARPEVSIALLTEGWTFEVYVPDTAGPRKVHQITLSAENADEAHLFFDSYLFQDTNPHPTSDDVVMRFGAASPTYLSFAARLQELWQKVGNEPITRVKWQEWNRLLAKVYGVAVGSDDLFLRHTYLSVLARYFTASALFEENEANDETARGLVNGKLQRACLYIEDHLQESLRVPQIATAVGVSASSLNQLFRRYLQTSTAQYIIARRIERASTLLSETNLAVTLIAEQTGFPHLEHRSRSFHRAAGVAPLAYRRRFQRIDQ